MGNRLHWARADVHRWNSFEAGFLHGHRSLQELSAREIEAGWPHLDAECFAQGMLDGIEGDTYRLSLIQDRRASIEN